MKFTPPTPLRLAITCGALLLFHAGLLEIMARTRIIEKVMASNFNLGEVVLILAFLWARFAVYFLVPAIVVAFLVSRLWDLRKFPPSK